MKLIQINTVTNNSTGKIMHTIQKVTDETEYETLSIVGRRTPYDDLPCLKIGNGIFFWIHVVLTTLVDGHGFGSYFSTKKIVEVLKKENPDIIHLHNVHGYYLNLPVLFSYFKNEFKGRIVWTFHDCWPMTGHCAYYTYAKCDKWMTECMHCPNKHQYPVCLGVDNSKRNYWKKKEMFSDLDFDIVVPSIWMKEQVKKSFLKDKKVFVINNGIDLSTFDYHRFLDICENVYRKYNIDEDKKIILGVASIWETRKGLDDFIKLAKVIDSEYQIVLVGLSKRQITQMPNNIIGIQRTENVDDLVSLYSAATVFMNPSIEESFSMVTIESMACGTPVIALDTSAVKELVNDVNGVVLHEHESSDYVEAIKTIEEKNSSRELIRSTVVKYSVENMCQGYLGVYGGVFD